MVRETLRMTPATPNDAIRYLSPIYLLIHSPNTLLFYVKYKQLSTTVCQTLILNKLL